MKRGIIVFALILTVLLVLQFLSSKIFSSNLMFWEEAILIERKFRLGAEIVLNNELNNIYLIFDFLSKLLNFLDSNILFFPSKLKIFIWDVNFIHTMISLPIMILLSFLLSLKRIKDVKIFLIIFIILWFIPLPYVTEKTGDYFINKTGFNIKLPWSSDTVWIWSGERYKKAAYTIFEYKWKQKNENSTKANIKISCLGHYQLFINDKSIYNGSSFAIFPRIYLDTLDIKNYIGKGENKINIICNFINKPVHEYFFYPEPALLVGGSITDGLLEYNLADNRLWLSSTLTNYSDGLPISQDAGFAEMIDFTRKFPELKQSTKLKLPEYQISLRPLPLLEYEDIIPKKASDSTYDFGRFITGYLEVKSNTEKICQVKFTWGVVVNKEGYTERYMDQVDTVKLPAGKKLWQQFSRRSGRYLTVDKDDCLGKIEVDLKRVGMPFTQPKSPTFDSKLDEKIYQISLNSLVNNVQDHFEDSVDREKAMYLGDTLAISKCLMVDEQNFNLVKEMIKQFGESQRKDGSFPSMTPSGVEQTIPSYTLQWIPLLELYVTESNDLDFAREMYPVVEKVIAWAESNESEEGFIFNKKNEDWWLFTDWTPMHEVSLKYSTILQIWYIKSLDSAANIASLIGKSNENYLNKENTIKNLLLKYAFDGRVNKFADSFDLENRSNHGLITNALAGKFGIFPGTKEEGIAILNFPDLLTYSPFSQTWVIEWLIKNDKKELAKQTMRFYWGGMVNEEATSIYEMYKPGVLKPTGSYSHAWGCGPVFLFPQILGAS